MFAAAHLRRKGSKAHTRICAQNEHVAERVVVVSNVSDFGGGGVISFRDFLLAIRKKRPDLDVIAVCPRKGDVSADCARNGITAVTAWTPWWAFGKWSRGSHVDAHAVLGALPYLVSLIPGIAAALLLLRRLRPVMVLSNTMTIPSHAIAARMLGIPHYWMVCEFGRDDHRLWFLFGYRRTIRLIGRLSDMVICNSRAVEQAMLVEDPMMETRVLYPVVDDPLAERPQRRPGERLRVVLVGYFSRSKGQALAIEAISIARQAGVDIALTVIGSGSKKPLRKLARSLNVEDLVTIQGPTSDLASHWAAAHVGLMCSECEAFGRVTVEAMRAGLPVCGTDSGGTPEIVEHGVAGLLSPPGDAGALAANLMAVESDETLRRRLAGGAVESSERFRRARHDEELASHLGLS